MRENKSSRLKFHETSWVVVIHRLTNYLQYLQNGLAYGSALKIKSFYYFNSSLVDDEYWNSLRSNDVSSWANLIQSQKIL